MPRATFTDSRDRRATPRAAPRGVHPRVSATKRGGFLIACSAAALALCTAALAQDRSDEETIQKFLRGDRDHFISYQEFVESIATKAMRDMDTDKDGSLSKEEIEAASRKESELNIPVIGVAEERQDKDAQIGFEALRRSIAASAQVRTLYDELEKEWIGSSDASALAPPRILPQIRIRF